MILEFLANQALVEIPVIPESEEKKVKRGFQECMGHEDPKVCPAKTDEKGQRVVWEK